MTPRQLAFALLLPLMAAPALRGQETPVRPGAFSLTESIRQATAIDTVDGRLTAGSWDYQATFTPAGMRFVPALGSKAPATQHLGLRLHSIERGGTPVFQAEPGLVRPAATGQQAVLFAHRKDLLERYDVRPEGLELSLRFDQALGGSGDLVARYHLDTSLVAQPQDGNGLRFDLAGIGGVHIGGVTGIDARGNRVQGSLRLDGDQLDLVLPAAFVDTAAWPLVLDPLVGTQFLAETGGWDDSQPDVAYDATNDVYLVAYRRVFSATSQGIRAQRISGTGTLVGGFLAMTAGVLNVQKPTVANLNLRDTFVVAWQQANSLFEPYDIMCCSANASTGAVSTTLAVTSTTATEETDPDAAGDNTTTQDEVLIVYTLVGGGIRMARVTVAAPGAAPTLASFTGVIATTSARNPAISKSQPSTGTYVITWSESSGLFSNSIRAQACNRSGVLLGGPITVTSGSIFSGSVGTADVDGNGTDFLAVYDYYESGGTTRDVWCRGLRWTGASLVPSANFTPIQTTATTDQTDPAVAWCRYKFLVVYADQFLPGANNYDIRGVELGANCANCGTPFLLTGLNGTIQRNVEFTPAVASKNGGGAASNDALLVFGEADDSPPFTSSLIAQRYTALGSGGAITQVGNACGTAATIGSSGGPFAIGNTDFRVTLSGIPAGAAPFILLGFPGGEGVCGSCSIMNQIGVVFVLPAGGTASYSFRVPCSYLPFLGTTVQVQWAMFNTTSTPCPLVPGLSMSRRMRLTLGL